MEISTPKQYIPLAGKPIALHSFELLRDFPLIREVIVACTLKYQSLFASSVCAVAGQRRQDSLFNALQKVSEDAQYILIHDAARPLLNEEDLKNVIDAGIAHGAATLATPVKATIKQADNDQMVLRTLDRSTLYEIQTPQVLKKELLIKGFQKAQKERLTVTDDVALAECIGHPVKLVMGSYENIKITTPEDLALAESTFHAYQI